jgi:hypothetical protein
MVYVAGARIGNNNNLGIRRDEHDGGRSHSLAMPFGFYGMAG